MCFRDDSLAPLTLLMRVVIVAWDYRHSKNGPRMEWLNVRGCWVALAIEPTAQDFVNDLPGRDIADLLHHGFDFFA